MKNAEVGIINCFANLSRAIRDAEVNNVSLLNVKEFLEITHKEHMRLIGKADDSIE